MSGSQESHLSHSKHNTSSWSSPECSPACHAGDRGFKSDRGCFQNGTVRKPAKRRSSNLRECLWVRLPPVPLEQQDASVGHWQAPLAVTQLSVWTLAVQLRPGALITRPVLLMAQDARPSFSRYGFNSRTGCLRRSGGIGRHATLRTSCP